MHLKSLTLKGFKSFASATTLRLEPGITCVVGPNGSGKSNVVDAISWVLGEQGAKALRGGKMEDVIFAGTVRARAAGPRRGHADDRQPDGALPIDYTEVSITRRMFRDGAGEYEINGSACRLLDIQELLSDSGIGRELHVVVGQGQLDSVLQSRPEDRRAYIEEAAGVLKHRKRKEKALRKLDGMQVNLTRLTDLTASCAASSSRWAGRRRSPAARRRCSPSCATPGCGSRRTISSRSAASSRARRPTRPRLAPGGRRSRQQLAVARAEQERLEAALAQDAPRLSRAQDTWYRLSTLAERLRGTVGLARERARHLAGAGETRAPGRDPDELEAEAELVAEQEAELVEAVGEARQQLAEVLEERAEHEAALAAAERAHLAAVRALADRRAGLATLAGRADALRSGVVANAEEIERTSEALAEADERTRAVQEQLEAPATRRASRPTPEPAWTAASREAARAHEAARERVRELAGHERAAEQQRAHWRARVEALSVGLARRDGSGHCSARERRTGCSARSPSWSTSTRTGARPWRRRSGSWRGRSRSRRRRPPSRRSRCCAARTRGGRCCWSAARTRPVGRSGRRPAVARGAAGVRRRPRRRWRPRPPARAGALARPCGGPCRGRVVDDLAAARAVAGAGLTAVTRDGDLLAPERAAGGSGAAPSALDVQAAVDDAIAARDGVEEELARLRPALEGARAEEAARRTDLTAAREAATAAERRATAAAAQLGRLEQAVRRRARRRSGCGCGVTPSRPSGPTRCSRWKPPNGSWPSPRTSRSTTSPTPRSATPRRPPWPVPGPPRSTPGSPCARRRSGPGRSPGGPTRCAGRRRRSGRPAPARPRPGRRGSGTRARPRSWSRPGRPAGAAIAVSLSAAAAERDAAAAARAEREHALAEVRTTAGRLGALLEKLVDTVHRDEVLRAQSRARLEALTAKVLDDHGLAADDLVDEYGPHLPVPASAAETAEYEAARERGDDVVAPPPMPYDRATQQRRAARAEKDLGLLGRVNPLALEEFAALEERYRFLSTQLEDLKNTRRDLLTVVREVDDKILEVFTQAYADVAREFETVFATLFPGGEGRLVLTDPSDMLTTGIEVEARPPGKKVKRLSLLSGGERSLTAMALLVAIFRARPSPFYVLDEIEAALDDVNLRRLISLLEELRADVAADRHHPPEARRWRSRTRCTGCPCAATASPR